MISREEAEAYWKGQLTGDIETKQAHHQKVPPSKPWHYTTINTWHYGKCELYDLMDYIYGGQDNEQSICSS